MLAVHAQKAGAPAEILFAQALPEVDAADHALPRTSSLAKLEALAARVDGMSAAERTAASEWLAALVTMQAHLGEEIAAWCEGGAHALS